LDKIIVIIPAFNESITIRKLIFGIKKVLPAADVLIVDDGSDDSTPMISKECGANVISLPFNCGYGTALQTGYKYAMDEGFDYCLQMDADGQHSPACLSILLDELRRSKADVVIGARFIKPNQYKAPFIRRMGIAFFSKITSLIIGQHISDPTSGFIGLRRGVLPLLVSDNFPEDYPDSDAIILLRKYGYAIKEVSVEMYPSHRKSMHRGLRPLYYVFKMLMSVMMVCIRRREVVR
jgi:glycosyltransferase involved in cell wall biosynthesis